MEVFRCLGFRGLSVRLLAGLLPVLLFLSFWGISAPTVSAASAWDSMPVAPTSLTVDIGACSPVDVTSDWATRVVSDSAGLDSGQKANLINAFETGFVAITQRGSGTADKYVVFMWRSNSTTSISWNASDGVYKYPSEVVSLRLTQAASPDCSIRLSDYNNSSSANDHYYFRGGGSGGQLYQSCSVSGVSSSSCTQVYRFYGNGTGWNANVPSGYAGTSLAAGGSYWYANYDIDYVPTDMDELREDTVAFLQENVAVAIALGAIVASVLYCLVFMFYFARSLLP